MWFQFVFEYSTYVESPPPQKKKKMRYFTEPIMIGGGGGGTVQNIIQILQFMINLRLQAWWRMGLLTFQCKVSVPAVYSGPLLI